MRRSVLLLSLVVSFLLSLVGCGGKGGRGSGSSTAKGAGFEIAWSGRSRAIAGPSSALSATVSLPSAAADGGDLVLTVGRKDSPDAYTARYTFDRPSRPGTYNMSVLFFAQRAAGGAVVAEGTKIVTLKADGSGIGLVGTTNAVASVEVLPGQALLTSPQAQLGFSAKDAQGNLVAITPNSATWTTVGSSSLLELTKAGVATARGTGSAKVQVSVDGKTSMPGSVFVSAQPIVSLTIDPGQSMPIGDYRPLTLSGKDAAGHTIPLPSNVATWKVVNGGELTVGISDEGTPYPTGFAPLSGTFVAQATARVGSVTSEPTDFTLSYQPPVVSVDPGQVIWPEDYKQLKYTARDAKGNDVTLPYIEETWSLLSGGENVELNGGVFFHALRPGTATVQVEVLGTVSAPQTVTVPSPDSITLTITPPAPTTPLISSSLTLTIKDAAGKPVTLPTSDVHWLTDAPWNGLSLSEHGVYVGIAPGDYSVRARAHGVYSAPVTITILPYPPTG